MRDNESSYDVLEAKRAKNKDLQEKIDEIDKEIIHAKSQFETVKLEHTKLTSQYDAIKQGNVWRLLKFMNKLKRFVKLCMKYIVGKRDRREIFSRSLKKKKAKDKIKKLKYSLYDLGFTDKALAELEKESIKSDNPYTRRYAAWELALWHANKYSIEWEEKCMAFLLQSLNGDRIILIQLKSTKCM